jgi:hypothetical protein
VSTNLSDRLDSFPEGWRPAKGDKLIGEVTELAERESEYGEGPYPIVTVAAEEGSTQDGEPIRPGTEIAWHAFHTMARSEVARKRPQVGNHVGIAYHGPAEKAPPGMNPPELWRLLVDKRALQADVDRAIFGERPIFSDDEAA